jgi:hypothetical protein
MKPKVLSQFFVLMLVVSLVFLSATAPALAAPPRQADDTATMEVWVSDIYLEYDPAGLMEIIALYPNNAAERFSIYFDDSIVVETGEWEAGDDGAVVLTLTDDANGALDEPLTLNFARDGEILTDDEFEYHALTIITPEDMESKSETEIVEAAEKAAADETVLESYVWVSNVYPAADAAGLINVVVLYSNDAVEQHTLYLGKDPDENVISEFGAWEEADDGSTVTITIAESLDEVYTEPVVTTYQWIGNALIAGTTVLMQWPEVAGSPVGVYGSDVYPAADAAGYTVILALYENGAAEQTTVYLTKGAVTEVGEWVEEDDGSITVTLTGLMDEDPYAEPIVATYARDVQNEVLYDDYADLYMLDQIEMDDMPADASADAGADASVDGSIVAIFESDVLPAADSPGRIVTLTLFDDDTFVLETDFMNDEPVFMEYGDWEISEDETTLTIWIMGNDEEEYSEEVVMVFTEAGDQIMAVEYDESVWGSEGLSLNIIE